MATIERQRKIVKPRARGQLTIPAEFRKALGIDEDTQLSVTLLADRLEVMPFRPGEEELRRYTDEEVARFMEEDKLDPEVGRRIKDMLRRGEL